MTANEKIEKISVLIDQEIKNCNISSSDVATTVSAKIGLTSQALSTVFVFLTGQTLSNYIKDRRMMAAYKYILECEKYDAEKAVELSGFGDQPAFNKKFKKRFGFTPTEVFERKDKRLLKFRLSWNDLSELEITEDNASNTNDLLRQTIYGVGFSKLKKFQRFWICRENTNLISYSVKSHTIYIKPITFLWNAPLCM